MYQAIDIRKHVMSIAGTDFNHISRCYIVNLTEKLSTVQYYCNLLYL